MKGDQGRRAPLSGLLDKFSIDALREQFQREIDKRKARDLLRMKAQARHTHEIIKPVASAKRGVTKRPIYKSERRAANRRARIARRKNRVS